MHREQTADIMVQLALKASPDAPWVDAVELLLSRHVGGLLYTYWQ
jgi:hypothetical protein